MDVVTELPIVCTTGVDLTKGFEELVMGDDRAADALEVADTPEGMVLEGSVGPTRDRGALKVALTSEDVVLEDSGGFTDFGSSSPLCTTGGGRVT